MTDTHQNKREKAIISVVLGSYNRLNYIKYTLCTIREELAGIGFKTEIIVVDGGSDDGTVEWLVKQKDIISIIQHNRGEWQGKPVERRSWGYFMNLAFRAAEGKYICMLSDDCLVYPGAIKKAYQMFEKAIEEGENPGACAFYFTNLPDQKDFAVNFTINRTMMINHGLFLKKALEQVGYIDEDNFKFYHADDDLALRLVDLGYRIIDSRDSFIEHFLHANIKLRGQVYITERDDFKALIDKWKIKYDINESSEIHASLTQPISLQHKYMPVFYNMYKKELIAFERQKGITYLIYKTKKSLKNFFMFFYYALRYFSECMVLLFRDRDGLRNKIRKTLKK